MNQLQEEMMSWRRVAEKLEHEKQALLQRLERYETTLQKITHTTTHLQAKFFAQEALKGEQ